MLGAHLVKLWASIQPAITLSSGDAGLHGVARGAAAGLGRLSLVANLGLRIRLRVWTDSTAPLGIPSDSKAWAGFDILMSKTYGSNRA